MEGIVTLGKDCLLNNLYFLLLDNFLASCEFPIMASVTSSLFYKGEGEQRANERNRIVVDLGNVTELPL